MNPRPSLGWIKKKHVGVHPVKHIKIQLDLKKKHFYFNFFKKIIQKN
jgi:hypothetical protein